MEILVNIDVPDLQRGIDFYTAGLGLTIRREFGGGMVELAGAGSAIFLLEKAEGTRPLPGDPAAVRTYRRHWCPVHLDFVVPDVHAAVERAVAAGAVAERPPKADTWGWLALMSDPFGNGFCLVQYLNRGYDEIATSAPQTLLTARHDSGEGPPP